PPRLTSFPYTTLFRSREAEGPDALVHEPNIHVRRSGCLGSLDRAERQLLDPRVPNRRYRLRTATKAGQDWARHGHHRGRTEPDFQQLTARDAQHGSPKPKF